MFLFIFYTLPIIDLKISLSLKISLNLVPQLTCPLSITLWGKLQNVESADNEVFDLQCPNRKTKKYAAKKS